MLQHAVLCTVLRTLFFIEVNLGSLVTSRNLNGVMKILEIGASSMLDTLITKDWYKLYRNNLPKYGVKIPIKEGTDIIPDVAIVSQGYKDIGRSLMDSNELKDLYKIFVSNPSDSPVWNSCVTVPYSNVLKLISNESLTKLTLVYLDSISTLKDVPYPHQADYAISKGALSTLLKNLCYLDDRLNMIDINIGSVKTKMCDTGMDKDEVSKKIVDIINDNYGKDFKYMSINLDNCNQINNLQWK